jgi:RNA polymerase sigma-70 factor (ECF subfamily)
MSQTPDKVAMPSDAALADRAFIEDLRRRMIKFAALQLGNVQWAEDAVQEALLGALENVDSFQGRAALRTWVFGILKNKIADAIRRKVRLAEVSSGPDEDGDDEDFSSLFDDKGFWRKEERPATWGNPEASLREGQFWSIFEACLEALPAKHARVFMMREIVELESKEICATLSMSTTNLHVTLHRARLRLRECLEDHWFLKDERR